MQNLKSAAIFPASAIAMGVALSVNSVTAEEWVLEEVVVTAQKRTESAQDIPLAVTALSSEMMKEIGGVTAQDIVLYTPGLTGSVDGGVSFTAWGIRGISTNVFGVGTEPSVGVYQDGGYIGRNLQAGAPLYDLNRVEVVKGPQGTLFGRNAVAGAISIHTEKPSTEESTVSVNGAIGNEDQGHGVLVANLPISDSFAVRVAGLYDHLGGVTKNLDLNKDVNSFQRNAGRISALYSGANIEVIARYEQSRDSADNFHTTIEGVYPDDGADEARGTFDNFEKLRRKGASLNIVWDINDTLTLTALTDWRRADLSAALDIVGITPSVLAPITADALGFPIASVNFNQVTDAESISQEFRLNASTGDFDWFVGVSWFHENLGDDEQSFLYAFDSLDLGVLDPGLAGFGGRGLDTVGDKGTNDATAVFGDIAWNVNDSLTLTLGARYTEDEKEWATRADAPLFLTDVDANFDNPAVPYTFDATRALPAVADGNCAAPLLSACTGGAFVEDKSDTNNTSIRLAADYLLLEDTMLYASFAQGYKAGGFNAATTDGVNVDAFDPEETTSYELGIKTELMDQTLRLNGAIYYNEYEDLQFEEIVTGLAITRNIGEAEITGLELDAQWLSPIVGLQFNATYAYTDTEVTNGSVSGVDVQGNQLTRAPENTTSFITRYDFPLGEAGELRTFFSYTWQDNQFFDIENTAGREEEAYGLLNARVTFAPTSEAWDISLSAKNLTDEEYATNIRDNLGGLPAAVYAPTGVLWQLQGNLYLNF